MKQSMKTPLGRVRGLGSAKSGTDHFWRQRLTAVAMVPLALLFVGSLVCAARSDAAYALETLRSPFVGGLIAVFVLNASVHMRIGMQVIIEDYVHGETTKIVAVIANTLFAAAVAAITFFAVLKLSFGI